MRGKAQLQQAGTKKGAWSPDEDAKLREVVRVYGHGRWNSLAQAAGLQRTGKSCRLRWLNYLRPNVRHGGFSLDEQLFILQLHLCWGNRWAKIAEQLPGRTDNDIKNYWRTRILKHAKHLNCDVNSPQFKHVVRDVWIPTLVERITSGSGLYMGHAHLPLNSPQDVGGPDATEKPMPECGASEDVIGPVGLNEAQNSPFSMGNGPDFDLFVFESSSPLWTPCELELELDFEMELGSEED